MPPQEELDFNKLSQNESIQKILADIMQGCFYCQSLEIEYDCSLDSFRCYDCGRTWKSKNKSITKQ